MFSLLRSHIDIIQKAKIGLMVCDEGHRLKNKKGNAIISALNRIASQRTKLVTQL